MRNFIFCFFCFCSLLFANDARTILNKFSTKYLSYKTVQGDFEYGLYAIDQDGQAQKKSVRKGKFQLKKDKYLLKLRTPEVVFFNNGKKIISYRPEDKEYESLEAEDVLFRPQDLFRNYSSDYNYSLKGAYHNEYVIELHKKNTETPLTIYLHLSKSYALLKIIYTYDDNKQTQIVLSNMLYDMVISDEVFNFEPSDYPGVEMI